MKSALTIDAVEIIPLDIVPERVRKMSTGTLLYSGKGGWVGRPVLVGVAAGGFVGWGEVRPNNPFVGETAASMFSNVRDFYAPLLIGRDAMALDAIWYDMQRKLPGNPAALSAVDTALHDLVGQALGVPVHTLLGGACRSEIPLEWSVSLDDENVMVAEAVDMVEKHSIAYVSIKIGPSERFGTDVRVAKAIQRELAGRAALGADANTMYDTDTSIRFANALGDGGLAYLEQPVRLLSDLRRVRDRVTVPVMADEVVYTLTDAFQTACAGAADVLAVKAYKTGGLRRSREIAAIAQAAGLGMNCAGAASCSYIDAVASAHLCASVPNHAFGAEFMMGLPSIWEDPIVANRPMDVKNGVCNVPAGPGLGIEVDRKQLKKHALTHLVIDKNGARTQH